MQTAHALADALATHGGVHEFPGGLLLNNYSHNPATGVIKLLQHEFVHVHVFRPRYNHGPGDPVFLCECEAMRACVNALSPLAFDAFAQADVIATIRPCAHAIAADLLMNDRSKVRTLSRLGPVDSGPAVVRIPLPAACDATLVSARLNDTDILGQRAFIVQDGVLRCVTCSTPKLPHTRCFHVKTLEKLDLGDDSGDDLGLRKCIGAEPPAKKSRRACEDSKIVSYVGRRVHEPSQTQRDRQCMRGPMVRPTRDCPVCVENTEECRAECRHCVPRASACSQCSADIPSIRRGSDGWTSSKGTLYGVHRCMEVDVYRHECSCGHTEVYDGAEDGIVNFTGATLMHEEIPRAFWNRFFDQKGVTFDAAHRETERNYEFAQTGSTLMSRQKFTACLQDFLRLVDTDTDAGMCCPVCKWLPDANKTLIFDGLEQGMPMANRKAPPVYPRGDPVRDIKLNEYLTVPHLETRRALKKYVKEDTDFQAVRALVHTHAPALLGLLDSTASTSKKHRCPEPMRRFLECLAANSAARSFVAYEASRSGGLLDAWLACPGNLEPRMLADIARTFPVLADLLRANGWSAIPDVLRPVLVHIRNMARVADREAPNMWPDDLVDESDWVCAPMFKSASARLGTYGADGNPDKPPDACTKLTKASATMSHGVVCAFCPHRVLVGLLVLSKHESPRAVFEFMRRKMTDGPRLVVYDNACALKTYCIKREPAFFSRTAFRVDRFHFGGHVGCSEGFSLDTWPPDTPVISTEDLDLVRARAAAADQVVPDLETVTYANLNSSVAEQANSRLRYIATPVAYMQHATYLTHMRQFAFRTNVVRIAGMYGRSELDTLRLLWKQRV